MFEQLESLKIKLDKERELKKTEINELFKSLNQYKKDMLAVDTIARQEFQNNFRVSVKVLDSLESTPEIFFKELFLNQSYYSNKATLSKFQNDIKVIENKMTEFCNAQVGSFVGYYTVYNAIITQSKDYVRPGNKIEVIAGVGAFSMVAAAKISFGKNTIQAHETGKATYIVTAPQKPGKYSVPVKINFTDQDGIKQTVTKNIEYTVVGY